MKKFKTSSRKSQKLAYALIKEYANHLQSRSPESAPRDYWTYKAKIDLKKLYLQATKEISEQKPLEKFNSDVRDSLIEAFEKDWTIETKVNVLIDDIDVNLKTFIEELAIQLGNVETFTLALRLCSQEKMTAFIQYVIDYYIDNEIQISKKTHEMILEEEGAKFTIACLKNRKCVITGKANADLHHVESYISRKYNPAYAKDLLVIPVCREMHNLCHNRGNKYVLEKYHITPVPEKLAIGTYTAEEIKKEIVEHKNPKTNSEYR